jgi:hypothetical protein
MNSNLPFLIHQQLTILNVINAGYDYFCNVTILRAKVKKGKAKQ